MVTDYDAIRRSPYYVPPESGRKKRKRSRTPGEAPLRLFRKIEAILEPRGFTLAAEPSRPKEGTVVRFSIGDARCMGHLLSKPFSPRPGKQGYLRGTISHTGNDVDIHIFLAEVEGEEPAVYIVPMCPPGTLRFPYPHHERSALGRARNAWHLLPEAPAKA